MSFSIKDGKLLKLYNKAWGKVCGLVKKGFYNEPKYDEKYLKAKTNSYHVKMNIGFHNNRVLKGCHCVCFSEILIDSVFRMSENYYPQVYLEEYKYVVKEMNKFIDKELGISSDESDEEVSDVETSVVVNRLT